MLQQTFIHIPGIGNQTELELWENGIHSWEDAGRFEKRSGGIGARLQKKFANTFHLHATPLGGRTYATTVLKSLLLSCLPNACATDRLSWRLAGLARA